MATHQITCAQDDCPEFLITGFYQPTTSSERAAKHRRTLAADGWGDYDGALQYLRKLRDGCRNHPKTTIYISR